MEHLRADALRAIADGTQVQRCNKHGEWSDCPPDMALFILAKNLPDETIRVRPRAIVVNSHVLPAPTQSSGYEVRIQLNPGSKTELEVRYCFDTHVYAKRVYHALIEPFEAA